jgi:Fe-S-cluster containining protein
MDFLPTLTHIQDDMLSVYVARLQRLFAEMDLKYDGAAEHYGFKCDGCEVNCCLTRFYHHTYLEYQFIRKGFENLDSQKQREIQLKADEICRQTARADKKGQPVRLMCPLNDGGLCTLYPYRPMICRLHGIPYELQKPGRQVFHGPGCSTFDRRCSKKSYYKFERTLLYSEMARLENEFKQAAGLTGRIKWTIAEMIPDFGSRKVRTD